MSPSLDSSKITMLQALVGFLRLDMLSHAEVALVLRMARHREPTSSPITHKLRGLFMWFEASIQDWGVAGEVG